MSDIWIGPGRLSGSVTPPPSKSEAHRALIAASLCHSRHLVSGLPEPLSEDLQATKACLDALTDARPLLDCGESGTTLRLLLPVAGALSSVGSAPVTFTGHGRLPQRPLGEYRDILTAAGLTLTSAPDAFLPLTLTGRLRPGLYQVPGNISSQYVSGLLFALPLLSGPSDIRLTTPLESAPYVDMTIGTLARFGIRIDQTPDGFHVLAPQIYRPTAITIDKDYSQAAFWLTAAYGGCDLNVTGLPDQTAQGDKAIVALLRLLTESTEGSTVTIDVAQIPDLVPILAVAAALMPLVTHFVHAGRLRHKESDRLVTTQQALWEIGADIEVTEDGLLIRGAGKSRRTGGLTGGTVDSWSDHRIAMAVAIAALFTRDGVLLKHAEAVRKSYPTFFHEFSRLGGDIHELDLGEKSENKLVW
ncbi:MAG: 3-phosphoshikimate 1-carboxyvinyltransferase [Bacillota bacterium]|nr:3-phosphoshikimate 1-carboxyvinyltransferase [Bacillota bacterium]